ncbi:MAG: hypothetical protein M5U01_24425 [Ardenticatenaceae bacterium]|nr:hypothetical protein [Ardenticatenaceae bacterium]
MSRGATPSWIVAAAQAAPVFLDQTATLEKACEWIVDAGAAGARLVVFPAAFIPAYPAWLVHAPAADAALRRELRAMLMAQSVRVPSAVTRRLGRMARRARTYVIIGVSEREGDAADAPLYHTLLTFDTQGELLGAHRQGLLAPWEAALWQPGTGDTLPVFDTPLGKLAGLPGEERYRPSARQALYAWGVQLFAVAGWAGDDLWLASLRYIAREGATVVLGCSMPLRRADIPARYASGPAPEAADEWLSAGDSVIVGPDGGLLAGPLRAQEGLLLAEIDLPHSHTVPRPPERSAQADVHLEVSEGTRSRFTAAGGDGRVVSQTRGL